MNNSIQGILFLLVALFGVMAATPAKVKPKMSINLFQLSQVAP